MYKKMPFKNGRYIRGGSVSMSAPSSVDVVQENSEKRVLEKVQEIKKEEAMSEDQKKERLKKFVSFKIKGVVSPPEK
jgi:hypothetical protein